MKSFSKLSSAKARRRNVIERLKEQLKDGRKTVNILKTGRAYEDLAEKDKERIKKELVTLESRV